MKKKKHSSAEYRAAFQQMDLWIRSAQGDSAQALLRELANGNIPTKLRLEFAKVARRLNRTTTALKLLNPIVRPQMGRSQASEEERAEYAVNLMRVGARDEAVTLLGEIPIRPQSKMELQRGFAYMLAWDYAAAIPCFERYLTTELTDYERAVGHTNLLAALVAERRSAEARALIETLERETREKDFPLLLGECRRLKAQNAYLEGDLPAARLALAEAESQLVASGSLERLLLRKWSALIELRASNASEAAQRELENVRSEAVTREHWETVRDCDRGLALAKADPILATHVYFGTPFESFRQGLVRGLPSRLSLPTSYSWTPGDRAPSANVTPTLIVDRANGTCAGTKLELTAGRALHRLFFALTQDFYRPQSIGFLHSRVYPNEYFNPHSSPHRLRRVLHLLRQELRRARVPLAIETVRGTFRLTAKASLAIHVDGRPLGTSESTWFERLSEKMGDAYFHRSDLEKASGLSASSLHRWLRWALATKAIERIDRGPATRYRFVRRLKQAA